MTLLFQIRQEDVLAFTLEYHSASPTFQRARTIARLSCPVSMGCIWLLALALGRVSWFATLLLAGLAALWFFLFPVYLNRLVESYWKKAFNEASFRNSLGPCELTLLDSGLHFKSASGESTFHWSAVDRILLTDTHLFIFLTGAIGYPIPLADIGPAATQAAYTFANARKAATTDHTYSNWRTGHNGRDAMYYEELHNGQWRRLALDGELLTGKTHHVIYFGSKGDWTKQPTWAHERRNEIIDRIKSAFPMPDYEYEGEDVYTNADAAMLVKISGGLSQETCAWAGCKAQALNGSRICTEHMLGARKRK